VTQSSLKFRIYATRWSWRYWPPCPAKGVSHMWG